jgi:hypothetical protein
MLAAGDRTRTAPPVPPTGNPVAIATAVPAQADPASASLPAIRKTGMAIPETGAAPRTTGFRARLSLRLLSFIAIVAVPIALTAFYLFAAASDQYVTEFRFTLNSAEAPRFDPAALLAGITAPGPPAALESQILVQYIGSRAIVDWIDGALDLRRLFSPPQADWWSRLWQPATIEMLVRYWKGQVDPVYDAANGTVTVRVRAFDSSEACGSPPLRERLCNNHDQCSHDRHAHSRHAASISLLGLAADITNAPRACAKASYRKA